MTIKIPCTKCGVLILPLTAERTGGICMPCHQGYGDRSEESRMQHEREKSTPQKHQDNITGFIVEVRPINDTPITYLYRDSIKTLLPDETFVGYFWQMTDPQDDGTFKKAHIHETQLVDSDKKLFTYGGTAVFSTDEVLIAIRALRGPDSNNRFLSVEFRCYETWNPTIKQ